MTTSAPVTVTDNDARVVDVVLRPRAIALREMVITPGGSAPSIVEVGLIEGVDLLSGVFDIHTRTPVPGTNRAALGLSMMNARALLAGARDSSAWLVSARRGYLDLVMGLIGEDESFSPKYSDVFARSVRTLNTRHELQGSLLYSRVDLDFSEDESGEASLTGYDNAYLWLDRAPIARRDNAGAPRWRTASAGRSASPPRWACDMTMPGMQPTICPAPA